MASANQYKIVPIDLELYATLVEGKTYPLYFSPWWLSVIFSDQEAFLLACYDKEGMATALFVAQFLAHQIITPAYCQYAGVHYIEENLSLIEQQAITQAFHQNLPKHYYYHLGFSPDYTDWLGLYWLGYKQTTRYNYIWSIDQFTCEEDVKQSIRGSLRKNLKATIKAGFTYHTEISKEEALLMISQNALYKGYKGDFELMSRLIDESVARGQGHLVGVKNREEVLSMVAFWVEHQGVSYLLSEGTDRRLSGRYHLKILMLTNYLLSVRERIKMIDFEGSMLEPIANMYQSLGAIQTSYMTITRGVRYDPRILWHRLFRWIGTDKSNATTMPMETKGLF